MYYQTTGRGHTVAFVQTKPDREVKDGEFVVTTKHITIPVLKDLVSSMMPHFLSKINERSDSFDPWWGKYQVQFCIPDPAKENFHMHAYIVDQIGEFPTSDHVVYVVLQESDALGGLSCVPASASSVCNHVRRGCRLVCSFWCRHIPVS